jgi:hypothetical protein
MAPREIWAVAEAQENLRADREILTLMRRRDTVRRFREYPERAVTKRLGGLWPAIHWIQEIHRRILLES